MGVLLGIIAVLTQTGCQIFQFSLEAIRRIKTGEYRFLEQQRSF